MSQNDGRQVEYVVAGKAMRAKISAMLGETAAEHMHFDNGFSIVPTLKGEPIGLISVYWRKLPPPLPYAKEGYIDIIEVAERHRRRGIATRLINLCIENARKEDAYQVRAWS